MGLKNSKKGSRKIRMGWISPMDQTELLLYPNGRADEVPIPKQETWWRHNISAYGNTARCLEHCGLIRRLSQGLNTVMSEHEQRHLGYGPRENDHETPPSLNAEYAGNQLAYSSGSWPPGTATAKRRRLSQPDEFHLFGWSQLIWTKVGNIWKSPFCYSHARDLKQWLTTRQGHLLDATPCSKRRCFVTYLFPGNGYGLSLEALCEMTERIRIGYVNSFVDPRILLVFIH